MHTGEAGLTIPSPLTPRARPSPAVAGSLLNFSRRFCWYSESMVIAASPLPRVPVIRDTAPAAPPNNKSYTFIPHNRLPTKTYAFLHSRVKNEMLTVNVQWASISCVNCKTKVKGTEYNKYLTITDDVMTGRLPRVPLSRLRSPMASPSANSSGPCIAPCIGS